jgi:hypothetical protein
MATVLTLISGDITVEEDIKVVQAKVERRAGFISLTDAADGSRVLISPAHVEKLLVRPELPSSPPTPFPRLAAQLGPSSDLVERRQ